MTDHTAYNGTWAIDPSHTRVGFVARHAMVTKVRGAFGTSPGPSSSTPPTPAARRPRWPSAWPR